MSTGWFHEVGTKLCAARLKTACGSAGRSADTSEGRIVERIAHLVDRATLVQGDLLVLGGSAGRHPEHLVALVEEQLREVGAVPGR